MKKVLIVICSILICIFISFYVGTTFFNIHKNLYTVISADTLKKKIKEKEDCIIFFYQDNCLSCKEAKYELNSFIQEYEYTIYAVNLSGAANGSFFSNVIGITETPTLIKYESGKEEKRITSIFSEEDLLNFIE